MNVPHRYQFLPCDNSECGSPLWSSVETDCGGPAKENGRRYGYSPRLGEGVY